MSSDDPYNALVLNESEERVTAELEQITEKQLREKRSDGNVLVSVRYSSLNYKDALAVTGRGEVVRDSYPFVPGIDLVGTVISSQSPDFREGDVVLQTGWDLGEKHWGGYSQRQVLNSDNLLHLPGGLSMKDAMIVGTAGFTAMISVMALEANEVTPAGGDVLVSGASGGVGSFSVALLADLGYPVAASTGSEHAKGYLRDLGAVRIIDRKDLSEGPDHLLESAQWMGAVDTVGGRTLATILSQLKPHGSVASCGNAGGITVETNVFPFILRGINWLGIDSNTYPQVKRRRAWRRLARKFSRDKLRKILYREIPLEEIPDMSRRLLDGDVQGRVIVRVQ